MNCPDCHEIGAQVAAIGICAQCGAAVRPVHRAQLTLGPAHD